MRWLFIFVIVCVLLGLSKQTGISTVPGKLNHYIDAGFNTNPSDEVDRLLIQSELFRDVLRKISSQDNELQSLKTRITLQEIEIKKLNQELGEVKNVYKEHERVNQDMQEGNILKQEFQADIPYNKELQEVNTLELKLKEHTLKQKHSKETERTTIQGPFGSKEKEIISNEMNFQKEGFDDVVTNERKLVRGIRAEEYIAFTAYIDHPATHLGSGQIIKCNQVILNDGNAYNPITGLFTAPQDGVFFITFTIHGISSNTDIRLVLDGHNLIDAAVYVVRPSNTGFEAYQMASNSCVIRVQKGQSLWLEHFLRVADGEVYGTDDFRHTTFTAFLLY